MTDLIGLQRIVLAGGPKTGKTTAALELAAQLGLEPSQVRHTDDVLCLGWRQSSEEVSHWFDERAPWIVEGVAAPRALRKWLAAHPTGRPCDEVWWFAEPKVLTNAGQARMAKGCRTVMRQVLAELRRRGVVFREVVLGGRSYQP